MSRGPDAATLLERALGRLADQAGCAVMVRDTGWDRWASATFVGARHRLTLTGTASPELDHWIGTLAETEIDLPGHLVADMMVASCRKVGATTVIEIEALTVENR